MNETIEGRVGEVERRLGNIEDLIVDLPQVMNLRLETIVAAQRETSGRMNLMEQQLAMLSRDVRDMRGGVTRMLVAQDKRLDEMSSRIEKLEGRMDGLDSRMDRIEGEMSGIKAQLATLTDAVSRLADRLA